MKRLCVILMILCSLYAADCRQRECGLPMMLDKYNIEQMQEKGFRLSVEDIYEY
jgi:hypothetical protein